MLSPVSTEETIGEAEVRALFKVSRLGTIAGCMVTDGIVRRNADVRVVRDALEAIRSQPAGPVDVAANYPAFLALAARLGG